MEVDNLISTEAKIRSEKIIELYKTIPNHWVLLEPIEFGKDNRALKVKILKYSLDKEVLRDYVLNQDNWKGLSTLIYFFTGSDGTCKI